MERTSPKSVVASFELNGVRRDIFYDPGTSLLSFEDPASGLKRARQNDISKTRKKTRSAPNQGRPRTTQRSTGDDKDEDTKITNHLYVGDCAGIASFYKVRLLEVNQTFLKQVVTKWLHVLEPCRVRKYGAYVPKKAPKELEPGTYPPWWPDSTPYVEPAHLGKHHMVPMAVDLMQIHRQSDKNKRTAFPSWIGEMKKHVDYLISTCPAKVFSSSNNTAFVKAMKETSIRVMNDMFSVAQSHEDHLIQNNLFEEMGNEDDGRGKKLTWSLTLKPQRKPSSKSKAVLISEGSEPKVEGSPHMEQVQERRSSIPNDVVLTVPANAYPVSQTPNMPMSRYIPAIEAYRDREPQVFGELQITPSYNASMGRAEANFSVVSKPELAFQTDPNHTQPFYTTMSSYSLEPQNIQYPAQIPLMDINMTLLEPNGLPVRFPHIPCCNCQGQLCMCGGQAPLY